VGSCQEKEISQEAEDKYQKSLREYPIKQNNPAQHPDDEKGSEILEGQETPGHPREHLERIAHQKDKKPTVHGRAVECENYHKHQREV